MRVYGFASDLERVELLYASLLLQATRDLVHVRPDYYGESTAAYRRSWLAGFASAVYSRLLRAEQRATAEQPATDSGTSTALVLRDRADRVDSFVHAAHPRLRTMRRRNLSGGGRTGRLPLGQSCRPRWPAARAHAGAAPLIFRLDRGRRSLTIPQWIHRCQKHSRITRSGEANELHGMFGVGRV